MAKKGKYAFWYGDGNAVSEIQNRCKQNYINKCYNIWMSKFKWDGLDEEMAAQEENFIMRKFWSDGTVAARNINNTDLMGDVKPNCYSIFYNFSNWYRQ